MGNFSDQREYDYVLPSHYQRGGSEVWQMQLAIWGPEAFIKHCEMTAFKYRMRMGDKPGQPLEQEIEKARWYEAKAKEIREELQSIV